MKRVWLALAVGVSVTLVFAGSASAGTYLSPYAPYEDGYKAGDCTMVTTRGEADATHVYTLNPSNTVNLNLSYLYYWGRNARCDELQFHVDHNTSIARLNSWLKSVVVDWFKNIGTTHYNNQTVSTTWSNGHGYEWFLVRDGAIHRIPDWLTALSWGLLMNDRLSIPVGVHEEFYDNAPLGAPVSFNDGPYATKIRSIWQNGDRDFSTLPASLATEINSFLSGGGGRSGNWGVFTSCSYQFSWSSDPYGVLLDWSWMLRNDGCPLAS